MSNWDRIKLEVEEFIIKDEPVDTVDELEEEGHETGEDDETTNIISDSHCFDESQFKKVEFEIFDTTNIKTEEFDQSEQQEFQAECSLSYGWKIDQQFKDEDSSSLQEQGSGTEFQCKICLKVFTRKQNLKRHINSVHEGKKEFKCTVCGRGFVRKDKLKRHLKIHVESEQQEFQAACSSSYGQEIDQQPKAEDRSNLLEQGSGTQFHCKQCLKVFAQKQCLKQHIKSVHEGKKEFKCTVCGRGFVRNDKLKRHMKIHVESEHQKFQAACRSSHRKEIDQQPKTEDSNNLQEQGSGNQFQCKQCLKVFTRKQTLKRHINSVHEGKKEFKCTVCGRGFVRNDKLKRHMKIHVESEHQKFQAACRSSHRKEIDQQPKTEDSNNLQEQGSGNQFQCKQCLKVFTRKQTLKRHINSVHEGKKEFKCTVCGRGFVRNDKLKRHMKIHVESEHQKFQAACRSSHRKEIDQQPKTEDSNNLQEQGSGNQFQCKQCLKVFTRKQTLKRHINSVHEGKKEFKCTVCGRGFVRNDKLKRHMKIHVESEHQKFQAACRSSHRKEIDQQPKTEDSNNLQEQGSGNQFQCKQCLKVFTRKQTLKRHINSVHEGKKQFKCTVCGKGCVRKDNLTEHMKTHEGKKLFKCPKCEKYFFWKHNLKQHMLIHEQKKEFKCAECGKKFLLKGTLKRHMLNVHKSKK